jgi:hypothetical protein
MSPAFHACATGSASPFRACCCQNIHNQVVSPPYLENVRRFVDQTGAQKVVDDMNRYANTIGPQFAPPQMLIDMAKGGKKFHQ